MIGYVSLRTRVEQFLRANPEVHTVTLARPRASEKITYQNANQECYGRMPETCPVLRSIVENTIKDDWKILREDGTSLAPEDLREDLFNRIHSQITMRFRTEFEEVCVQKHEMLNRLRGLGKSIREVIGEVETSVPPDQEERIRNRRKRNTKVEIEVDEEI